jgi:dolichol kinase
MAGRRHSEDARKAVHILFGAGALLLRYLAWWQAAAVAAAAVVLNTLVLPRLAPQMYRPTDRRFAHGILFYPLAVLGLVLVFPRRLDIAAAAWAILAAGDGAASLVGQRAGRRRLPWNTAKSVEGFAAFFLCGAAAGTALALWCRPAAALPPPLWFSMAAPVAAALVAAFVESMPIGLDDNLSVPAAAGGVMWTLSLVDAAGAAALAGAVAAQAAPALGVNAVVAWLGW